MSRKLSFSLLGLFAITLLPGHPGGSSILLAQSAVSCPTSASLTRGFEGAMAHVRYLADDALEGREAGTHGARCAADYIASFFRESGLQGAGPDGSFFQTFEVRMGSTLREGNALDIDGRALGLGQEWIPFGFSSSASVSGPLVYGGPGVSVPGDPDDRYAHLDIEGKIVVVEGADPHGSERPTLAGDPHHKASIAAGRGAAAVLVLLEEGQSLPDPVAENRPSVRIPALAISGPAAQAVRDDAQAGRPVDLTAALEPRMVEVRNVVAMIPGSDPTLGREVVVVGAHYDHLGHGGDGSLDPDSHDIHNGADDNASGTAALMEVARHFAASPEKPARTVLFLAFTGEEKGLWGSGHYVKNPLLPLENTVTMLNMDMVGRLRENTLTVYGTGTAEEFPGFLEEVNQAQPEPFVLASIPDGFGPSDHSAFYGEDVPVLMLFTNTHSDYHRPEDDWDRINVDGLDRVVGFAADVTGKLAGSTSTTALAVHFVEGAGDPHGGGMPAEEEGAPVSRGYGAYFGTIPDMTPQDHGVRITGVREESPAEAAGLQGGDVIVEFGGREITDLYAYTYALREHQPGDEVVVVVIRNGERLSLTAVLGQR
jgi:aminopeptidase YwaD